MKIKILLVILIFFISGCDKAQENFFTAIRNGDINKVKDFIDKGINVNKKNSNGDTSIHVASSEGRYKILKLLLLNGGKVNVQNNYGWTPLHEASSVGFLSIVKLLVENGIDINIKNRSGFTALDEAKSERHSSIIIFLIDRGATSSGKKDDSGNSNFLSK